MACTSPINPNASSSCVAWVPQGATGYVSFYSSVTGESTIEPIDASGYAVAPSEVNNAPAGSYYVAASYSGDQTYASEWTFVGVTVENTGKTTTSMSVTCTPTTFVSPVTLTCTAQLPAGATGSVGFNLDQVWLGGAAINANGQGTVSTTTSMNSGTHLAYAGYGGDSSFTGASAAFSVIDQTTPTITWPSPVPITYGTPVSVTQLNATANVSGTFVYSPALGTVLPAGTQTLSVTFTPNDTTDYTTATATVTLNVQDVAIGPWIIYTVAGDYIPYVSHGNGFSGDGGPATSAALADPAGVALDNTGNFSIADTENSRIRKVTAATGVINTYAGNGGAGYDTGDGGPATAAALYRPSGVTLDSAGNLYIQILALFGRF